MLHKIKIKFLLLNILFFITIFSTSLFAVEPLKKVTLQLSWFDQFQFAGYYIAKEKGYYAQAGFDVEILPFKFGLDIPEDVATHKVDFAIGRETLILDRAQNKKIIALYALFQSSPLVLISKQSSHIDTLADFKNKRIMTTIDDASEVSLKAMLTSSHLKQIDYTFLPHSHNVDDLINDNTDIMSAYISKAPFELKQKGVKYNIFSPKEYGFDMYSDFLYTSEKLVSENLQMVEAFKNASLKGWQYAYSHTEESVNLILKKYNTQRLSYEALVYEAEELKKLSFLQTKTLGEIDKSKLQRIYDLYNVMGFIPNKISLNEFVLHHFGSLSKEEKLYLSQKKEIKLCADPNWMPFEQIKNGKLVGISIDYINIISKQINTPFTLIPTANWDQSLSYAKQRKCDIFSLAMETPERKTYMDFTSPYLSVPLVIATKMDKFFISSVEEILDKKIGIVKGYSFVELLKLQYPKIQLIEVKDIKDGLEKVAKGELYGFIDGLLTIGYVIQKEYFNVLKIGGKLPQSFELGFGVRNDEPILTKILEKAINSIDENTKQNITNKWVNVKFETATDYTLIKKIIAIATILFLILAYRYFTMQKHNNEVKKNMEVIDKYVLFVSIDSEGNITNVSEALCQLSGYKKYELVGKHASVMQHPEMKTSLKDVYNKQLMQGKTWEGELKKIKKDGTPYWVYAKISPTIGKDGKIKGYSSFQSDITDKKRIEEVSHTDSLTQIHNRLYLDMSLKNEFSRVVRYPVDTFSIILLDIDFFKEINDSHGHSSGDKILIELAHLIKTNLRTTDVFGRWGGEEFLIICPNTKEKEATLLAGKTRVVIAEHEFYSNLKCTCSFGVTQYKENDNEDSIFLRADKALYKAKEEGRNRVVTLL